MLLKSGGSAESIYLNRLTILHKRALRVLNDKRPSDYSFLHSDPLFQRLGVLKVEDIFKLRMCTFYHQLPKKTSPENFHSWFTLTSQVHTHNTRSKFVALNNNITTRTLYIQFARTAHYGNKLLKVLGAKIWNNLPPTLRVENITYFKFKEEMTKFLIDKSSLFF